MTRMPAGEARFDGGTVVADALAMHPKARWVFAAYHIGGCNGCSQAGTETLAEVAAGYRIPLDRLLADLNSLDAVANG
jgi:hybrid cluster-associated redox disulfide protein